MKYDPEKYREVGVGNFIRADHSIVEVTADGGTVWRMPENHEIGAPILDGTPYMVLEMINPEADKQVYQTGAARSDATGRGRFDLIPYEAMLAYAQRLEYGVSKGFKAANWEKGLPLSRCLSSMRRHSSQVNYDFSEDHIGAVLFNAGAFATIVARIEAGLLPKELDDIGYFANRRALGGAK